MGAISLKTRSMSDAAMLPNYRLEPCVSRVLRFHRVQSRQSENGWRLDRPYCGGNCCDIPCLVDAATVCAVAPAAHARTTTTVDTSARPSWAPTEKPAPMQAVAVQQCHIPKGIRL